MASISLLMLLSTICVEINQGLNTDRDTTFSSRASSFSHAQVRNAPFHLLRCREMTLANWLPENVGRGR